MIEGIVCDRESRCGLLAEATALSMAGARSKKPERNLAANRHGLMPAFFLPGPIFPALRRFFAGQRPA